ncbi:DUF1795 domain-containing protein [Inquilinus limosus]|uniref:DUF1795 domain-containing protein n=1 Tax=Inquilinus limosus TaxID=171674 RepID=UPI0004152FB6|nr:DUF1795 domain-containing protein [Inquilinus limosus]
MYHLQEGVLDVPAGWEDQSVNVFAAPGAHGGGLSFVVTREALPGGLSIRDYGEREIRRMSKETKQFSLLGRHPVEIAGQTVDAFEVRWKSERGLVHQVMAAAEVNGRVMIFTATMPTSMPADTRDRMLRVMASFRLYSDAGA